MTRFPWHVTLTGADDGTDPADLAKLSEEFPFAEWGILWSMSREGQPRYPTLDWRLRLYEVARQFPERQPMRLASHLCGAVAREALSGARALNNPSYQRSQLNGFDVATATLRASPHEIILQCRAEADLQAVANFAAGRPEQRFSILFDPSGGRGLEPFRWPPSPLGVRMGFAGGINPGNVLTVLGDIVASNPTAGPTWIDMESGVRTDDRFDLGKVRSVLEQVAECNRGVAP